MTEAQPAGEATCAATPDDGAANAGRVPMVQDEPEAEHNTGSLDTAAGSGQVPASQAQEPASTGELSEQPHGVQAAAGWGLPPPARPPTTVLTANTDVQKKIENLSLLMKRKYSLDQEDQEDPLVIVQRKIEVVDLEVTKFLLLQQLRHEESALAAELNKVAGVINKQREVLAAQAQMHAGMALKQQQQQQEVQEMQRHQQEFLDVLENCD